MSAKVLTKAAAKEAGIDLIQGGRGSQAVHDTLVAMRAARRSGSANTKTKAEVDLSGAKPWRQKGTGRARAGYKSSPIWRGGGVVFGPKPRDYSKKVGKCVRRSAQETNRRRESAHRVRFVRRENLQVGPQREAREASHPLGCEHRAVARVPENSHYGEGLGNTGGKNACAFAESYGAIK